MPVRKNADPSRKSLERSQKSLCFIISLAITVQERARPKMENFRNPRRLFSRLTHPCLAKGQDFLGGEREGEIAHDGGFLARESVVHYKNTPRRQRWCYSPS